MIIMTIVDRLNKLSKNASGVSFCKFLYLHQFLEQLTSFTETNIKPYKTLQQEKAIIRPHKCHRF